MAHHISIPTHRIKSATWHLHTYLEKQQTTLSQISSDFRLAMGHGRATVLHGMAANLSLALEFKTAAG
jgi:hypothetical protein